MNKCRKRNIIAIILIAAAVLCIAFLYVFNTTELKYWIPAKTGLFYPAAQKFENISEIEQMWLVPFPEGTQIEKLSMTKSTDYSDGDDVLYDKMMIKYRPYYYDIRVTIPSEKTEEFIDSVRKHYADITYDDFEGKIEISLPEIMSDLQDVELSYGL